MSEEMNELFYRDVYCREFDAQVVSCEKGKKYWEIVLEDTAFYPEGGGQAADHGTLDNVRVLDVHRRDGRIIHYCDGELPVNSTVHGVIDWQRRFDHMQNHSGEHIVSGIIHKLYGYENVGFHMGEVIQIDFDGELNDEDIHRIEREANERIWKNIPVEITYPSEEELQDIPYRSKKELEGTVRIVTIEDTDICACCGTHVRYTGEVGVIHLLSVEKHKSGCRIEMLAGQRAWQWLRDTADQNIQISHLFSAKPLETADAVRKYMDQNREINRKLAGIKRSYIEMKAETLPETDVCVMIENDLDADACRMLGDLLLEKNKAKISAVFTEVSPGVCRFVWLSRDHDLKKITKALRTSMTIKGGGNAQMQQGMIEGNIGQIKKTAEQAFREAVSAVQN
ncbi:MAG: hypothetical protein IJJ29_03425 [Solobacterium sp.]|nr:hypothetical protein [Solobacterium sp.]